MKERIKELYDKSQKVYGYTDGGYTEIKSIDPQKFAELIIRECMTIIKQNENASLNVSNFTDEKKQGIQLGLEFAITDIAEHFGVEE